MKRAIALSLAILFLAVVLWTSAPCVVSAQAAPAAPSGFQVSSYSASQIDLSWSAVAGATSYQIYRSTGTSTSYTWIAMVTTRSYRDSELKAATRYNYKVRAVQGSSVGSFTTANSAYTRPAVPTGLTAKTISTTQIDLSWTAVSGVTSYQVYRSSGTSTTYMKIAAVTTPKYSDKGRAAGTRYNYKVCAVNSGGTGGYAAKTAYTKPTTLTGLTAKTISASQIDLSWTAVTGATSYQVYRSTGTSTTYAKIATVTTPKYSNIGLAAGTRYNYKVLAANSGGAGGFSVAKVAYTRPATPAGLAAKTISTSQIDLSWTAVTGAASYQVYRSTGTSTTYTKIVTVTTPKYSDTGRSAGTRYNYKVLAANAGGASGFSAVKIAYTKPAAPTGLAAKRISTTQINLTWIKVTGATSYKVYVAKNGGTYAYKATTTALSFSHTGLTVGSYQYKVSAVAASLESGLSLPTASISLARSVTGVSLDQNTVTLTAGESLTLHPTIAPADAANKSVIWSSSNAAIASVSNGVVTAKAAGSAVITVKTVDGSKTAACSVTVNEYLADGIYTFLIKDGGKAMNLDASTDMAADKNGTRVTIWSDTGHSTQRFRVQNIGNHKCRIYAMSSSNGTNRVLNLDRNSTIPITAGIGITLWQVSAAEDQEWIASKTADGYYRIALAAKPDLVIGCDSPGTNGADLKLQQYSGSGAQLWQARIYTPAATILPLSNVVVSSEYGWRTLDGVTKFHYGIDMYGASAIRAVADAVVQKKGFDSEAGNYVVLRHSDGHYTCYFHCKELNVSEGQSVTQGQQIAVIGETGDARGVHLHFEVRTSWLGSLWAGNYTSTCINPAIYVPQLNDCPRR